MALYNTADEKKHAAALAALDHVQNGMRLGLGTGSTAAHFVRALGKRVAEGLSVRCTATSEETARLAASLKIPLFDLDDLKQLDLTVDGADEISPDLTLIKGAGGALLREKIVASASQRMIVIADDAKLVATLGVFPLSVEIAPFAHRTTMARVAAVAARAGCAENLTTLRGGEAHPFRTDQGNFVADLHARLIPDPAQLAGALAAIPGVVEHGLFLELASLALVAGPEGVRAVS